jgi:hypothetical protein
MYEVIDLSLTSMIFDINVLDDNITKMDSHTITFNVNVIEDGKVEPLETIMNMIKSNKKITVTKVMGSKRGVVLFKIILNDFQFTSVDNLFDFDYSKPTIMDIRISYTFKDVDYINTSDKIIERALKIHKILGKDYEWCKLTKKELNL